MFSCKEADILTSNQTEVVTCDRAGFEMRSDHDGLFSDILPTTVYCGKASKWYNAEDQAGDKNTVHHHNDMKQKDEQQVLKLLQTINLSEGDSQETPALVSHFLKLGETPHSSGENMNTFSTDEETSSTVSSMQEYLQKARDAPRSENPRKIRRMMPPIQSRRKCEPGKRQGDYYTRREYSTQESLFPSVGTSYDRRSTVGCPFRRMSENDDHCKVQGKGSHLVKRVSRSCWVGLTSSSSKDQIYESLYNRSQRKQAEGKERREAIARANFERNWIPNSADFGTIPHSRAEDMYHKGKSFLRKKHLGLHKKQGSDTIHKLTTNKLHDKIPQSRAQDMYYKGMSFLQKKQTKLNKNQASDHGAIPPTPAPSRKIPVSNATDLYDRGIDFLQTREKKFKEKRHESGVATADAHDKRNRSSTAAELSKKKNSGIRTRTKMRSSELCAMDRKKKHAHTSTIPNSRATDLYDRGIRYLRAKETRRHLRQGEISAREKQNPIPLIVHVHSECPSSRQIVQEYTHAQHLYHHR